MKFHVVSSIALLFAAQQAVAYEFIAGCLQNHTITTADSCVSVAAQFQITEAEFYAMNPGLHHSVQHDCDNLDTGKNYCVCLKAPCPVSDAAANVAPAASAVATNGTRASVAVPSAASASASAPVSSAVSSTALSAASSASPSPSVSASASPAPNSQTPSTNSATITTAVGAITIGLVMTATTMLL